MSALTINREHPTFFIVGAPRCGTPALSDYLRSNPNVFVPRLKEPNFFSTDTNRPMAASTLDGYLALFSEAGNRVAGEGSVWYLYSQVAIPAILEFEPMAKIIIMVRNPIDMVRSWHAQRLYTLNEDEPDFEKAWRKCAPRSRGLEIPEFCREPELLQYKDVSILGSFVKRAMNIVPSKQIKVIVFDDFVKNTSEVYRDVLAFLSVPNDSRTEFPQIHGTKYHRSPWFARQLKRKTFWLKHSIRLTARLTSKVGFSNRYIIKRLGEWNTRFAPVGTISDQFRKELVEEFREDVSLLGCLLNRDLGHWLAV